MSASHRTTAMLHNNRDGVQTQADSNNISSLIRHQLVTKYVRQLTTTFARTSGLLDEARMWFLLYQGLEQLVFHLKDLLCYLQSQGVSPGAGEESLCSRHKLPDLIQDLSSSIAKKHSCHPDLIPPPRGNTNRSFGRATKLLISNNQPSNKRTQRCLQRSHSTTMGHDTLNSVAEINNAGFNCNPTAHVNPKDGDISGQNSHNPRMQRSRSSFRILDSLEQQSPDTRRVLSVTDMNARNRGCLVVADSLDGCEIRGREGRGTVFNNINTENLTVDEIDGSHNNNNDVNNNSDTPGDEVDGEIEPGGGREDDGQLAEGEEVEVEIENEVEKNIVELLRAIGDKMDAEMANREQTSIRSLMSQLDVSPAASMMALLMPRQRFRKIAMETVIKLFQTYNTF